MRMMKFLAGSILSLLLLTACNDNEFDGVEIPSIEAGTGYVSITLADDSNSFGTRSNGEAEGTEAERNISSLEFYVFNSDGLADGEYRYVSYDMSNLSDNNQYTFPVSATTGKTILVAANANLGGISQGSTVSDLRTKLLGSQIINPLVTPTNGIPMAGESKNVKVTEDGIEVLRMTVHRLYARFNAPKANSVWVNLPAFDADELEALEDEVGISLVGEVKFDLKGFYVINGLKDSYAFTNYGGQESDRWSASAWELGNNLGNYIGSSYSPTDGSLVSAYSGSGYLTTENVYLYENCPLEELENGMTVYNRNSVYAIIVKADLYNTSDINNKSERYWRINVNKGDDAASIYKILRNAIYRVNITQVTTIGYGTAKDAEEEKPLIPGPGQTGITVEIDIEPWQIFDEDVII